MKRSYPYTGPRPQAQGAQQLGYGQPPPPAGPAPSLPSSGPPPPAYANYGYGAAAPVRQPAAPLSGAGTFDAQQPQWNQQWQQHYPPPPAAASIQGAGPYSAPRPPAQPQHPQPGPYNQTAGYAQPQTPMHFPYQGPAASMQTQSPSQSQQPFGQNSHGYTPPAPQHQHGAQNNAQNWPGAYVNGGPSGPPNKKARYQASSGPTPNPAPVSPFVPPGVSAANMAGGGMGSFPGPNSANVPTQPPYAWQGPHAAPPPPVNQQHQGPIGRVSSGSGVHANAQARGGASSNRQQGGKAGRGASGNMAGQGLNRNGANNRGNMSQRSPAQRAGLPANPNVDANAARPQNGAARAWGSQGIASGSAQSGAQPGRRGSTASSVQSDKNSKRTDKHASGSMSKPGFSSQNMIPLSATRGPSSARNNGGKDGSKQGGVATAQVDAEEAGVGKSAGLKRAHTDFRIISLEIEELGWSWSVSQAIANVEEIGEDGVGKVKAEPTEEDGLTLKKDDDDDDDEKEEAAELVTVAAADIDAADAHDNVDEAQKAVDVQDVADEIQRDDRDGDAEHNEDLDDALVEAEQGDEDNEDHDHDGDGDGDGDADGDADNDEDVTALQADIDTVASQMPQQPVTPAASAPQGAKAEAGTGKVQLGESTKLRLCFAAMSNSGPEGAPTGPKAENVEQAATNNEKDIKVEEQNGKGATEDAGVDVTDGESKLKVEDAAADSGDAEQLQEAASKPEQNEMAASCKTEIKASAKGGPPQLSLNRIFLSYASNRKRLAIDARAVSSVRIHRSEGWIEMLLSPSFTWSAGAGAGAKRKGGSDEYFVYPGVLLEHRDKGKGQDSFSALTRAQMQAIWQHQEQQGERDEVPPLHKAHGDVLVRVALDQRARLPEPVWVRTNKLAELLAELEVSSGSGSGHVWDGKVEVCDPDPPPSMATVLGEWVKESNVGGEKERRKFVASLLGTTQREGQAESDDEKLQRTSRGLIELVSRLVRGERVAPSTPLLSSALASAQITKTATYPGLVLLALIDRCLDQEGVDVKRLNEYVDALLMEIPKPVLVKAVDLAFRDVVDCSTSANGSASASAAGGRKIHTHNHNHNHNRGGAGKRKRG